MERKIEDIILDELNDVLQHFLMHAELESVSGISAVSYHYSVDVDQDQYDDPNKVVNDALLSIKPNIIESCKSINRFRLVDASADDICTQDSRKIKVWITGLID